MQLALSCKAHLNNNLITNIFTYKFNISRSTQCINAFKIYIEVYFIYMSIVINAKRLENDNK